MKKQLVFIILVSVLSLLGGCKKEKTHTRFPTPEWKADDTGKYPYSMTAIVKVPKLHNKQILPGDKVAAFVGDECRGVGVPVEVNGHTLFYVMVQGSAAEEGKVHFQYYDSENSYLLKTVTAVDFVLDGNYGTADHPIILYMHYVE